MLDTLFCTEYLALHALRSSRPNIANSMINISNYLLMNIIETEAIVLLFMEYYILDVNNGLSSSPQYVSNVPV